MCLSLSQTEGESVLLSRLLEQDAVTEEVEARYVKVAQELTAAVAGRSKIIDELGGKSIKIVIARSDLDIPSVAAKRWEGIQKGRSFWKTYKEDKE
jgi:hypothetical protein